MVVLSEQLHLYKVYLRRHFCQSAFCTGQRNIWNSIPNKNLWSEVQQTCFSMFPFQQNGLDRVCLSFAKCKAANNLTIDYNLWAENKSSCARYI